MAIYYARKTGNVNATDVWATTPTGTAGDFFSSFTNQDVLVANSFTITLNVNTTVLEVRTDTTGGATTGGGFTLNNGITLNANVYAGSSTCVTFSLNSPNSATVNGNIIASPTSGVPAIVNSGSGTLSITGNITAGAFTNSSGASNGAGILNIIGNIRAAIGGALGGCIGLGNSSGTVNITGNIYGGAQSGGNANPGINNSSGTINVTGLVVGGGGTGSVGIANSIGTINVIGTVIGGTGAVGVVNSSTGVINVTGIAIGSAFQSGASNSTNGTIIVTRAKGNGFGPSSVGLNSVPGVANTQNGTLKVYEIEYGTLGQSPTSGPIELLGATSNVAVFATRFGQPKTLVDLNNSVNLVPTSGNVRSGVAYNYGNDTGSCVVPHPNSVVYGVPVDNTAGSGLLSPVAVWNALTNAIGTSGSIAERLKNCSTVSTVGKQLEGVL